MIFYISGPMRGLPNLNFAAFDSAKAKLVALGHSVVSPADLDRELGKCHAAEGYARRDANAMINKCDAILLLPGWEKSRGAVAEFFLARWCEYPVYNLYGDKLVERSYTVVIENFVRDQLGLPVGD